MPLARPSPAQASDSIALGQPQQRGVQGTLQRGEGEGEAGCPKSVWAIAQVLQSVGALSAAELCEWWLLCVIRAALPRDRACPAVDVCSALRHWA